MAGTRSRFYLTSKIWYQYWSPSTGSQSTEGRKALFKQLCVMGMLWGAPVKTSGGTLRNTGVWGTGWGDSGSRAGSVPVGWV